MSRERYICMNHPEESWIFDSSKDDPTCPKCKRDGWVFFYSGDKKPQRVETKKVAKKHIEIKHNDSKKDNEEAPKRGRGRPKKVSN